eukprot:5024614-Pyramimonas_sp.AAC.1
MAQHRWCKLCDASYSVSAMWCKLGGVRNTLGGVCYVVHASWCKRCDERYAVQARCCKLCGVTYVVKLCDVSFALSAMWSKLRGAVHVAETMRHAIGGVRSV